MLSRKPCTTMVLEFWILHFELNPFSPAVSWYKERLYRFLNVSRDTFGLMLTIAKDDIESINSDTKQNNQK